MTLTKPITLALLCLSAPVAQAADLTVTITGVTEAAGTVRAALHDGAAGFPRERKIAKGAAVPATTGSVTLVFRDVAPGRYAIAAFHDADGDETLTTNLLNMPTEPFGFSQGARGSFGPPTFDDAAFEVKGGDVALTFALAK